MDSTELNEFLEWKRWPKASTEAPRKPGVYVFRLVQKIPGLKGSSDIVYIGSTTKGQRTLYDRLKDHRAVRKLERNTGHYLDRVQREVKDLEVSWKPFQNHEDALDLERTMIDRYTTDHIDFPPLNRQESGRSIRMLQELLDEMAPGTKVRDLIAWAKTLNR